MLFVRLHLGEKKHRFKEDLKASPGVQIPGNDMLAKLRLSLDFVLVGHHFGTPGLLRLVAAKRLPQCSAAASVDHSAQLLVSHVPHHGLTVLAPPGVMFLRPAYTHQFNTRRINNVGEYTDTYIPLHTLARTCCSIARPVSRSTV